MHGIKAQKILSHRCVNQGTHRFVTKYRHRVIHGDIEKEIVKICQSICAKNDCILEEAKADLGKNDPIHLLIDLAPKVSISVLCNTLKTVTSREIRKHYAEELKPYYWKPVFWKRGFSVVSAGGASLEVLKEYIEIQLPHLTPFRLEASLR